MLCEHCGQRDATVHFVGVTRSERFVRELCESCAADAGLKAPHEVILNPLTRTLGPAIAAVMDTIFPPDQEDVKCASCGTTRASLRATGLLGCAACYETFAENLAPLFAEIASRAKLYEATPTYQGDPAVESLRGELQAAIAAEEF